MNDYMLFAIAMIPVLWLIVSLGVLKMPAHKTCSFTVILTLAIAIICWRMKFIDGITATVEGMAIALWPILLVIVAALFTYNLAVETKTMDVIKKMLSSITTDKRIQVLILAWGFGGFLEAVAGYGTAVAIPASILASLGFNPLFAAVICLLANTVPTAFGALGIPVTTLATVTGLEVVHLSYVTSIQLAGFIVLIPFLLVILTEKSIKALKGVVGITLVSGITFAIPQIFIAKYLGADLPALVASICSMACTILMAKAMNKEKVEAKEDKIGLKEGVLAWLPYILLCGLILIASPLVPSINSLLAKASSNIHIYTGDATSTTAFSWINTPGMMILIATFIAGLIQKLKFTYMLDVLKRTIIQLKTSFITIMSIVAISKIMSHSGMTSSISFGLCAITGSFYPLIAPLLGAIGTFVTGSDTSANILFGALQTEAAKSLSIDPYWIAAANTAGATAGKMISPQSIAIATSATGLIGSEGKILSTTVKYCLGYVIILGLIVYFGGGILTLF
ncbi:L-lactate permease [Intestinibacter bartlettii]|uniref:L-lactate permease n=1 Tax=Intestinibacter bartlettii TaxID=261299 RepID=A0ABS8CTG5_9FIRM|nr:L-lactate permease [Intestinibacter bartlettii]MCB5395931.1 L-lactate permease [Intestinibacter bartlettii]MCB5402480.1 L-lactate permease [Intestinibacter bartlettii]MCB5444736.1 L-lactate permease [Intestinibacter bartlettii]MCB5719714.1 L-lactate permease [Intestinibacter bartlettii]MCB5747650.1 L-lactate permease [Intestinibacter bartlettii]